MPSQVVQKMIVVVVLLSLIIGIVAYESTQVQRQSYASEVAYATTVLEQSGDFIREHASHGGKTTLGQPLQFGSFNLAQEGICIVRFDIGGGNIITLYQGLYSQLRYQTANAVYGDTWVFDRGDRARAYATSPSYIDAVYHYSTTGYTYAELRTATYIAVTKTENALSITIYVFRLESSGKGGSGAFTLSSKTTSIGEHVRFMAPSGGASPALYVQTGTGPDGRPLEQQVTLPALNAGDLIDVAVNLVDVTVTW
jgi:hypothetical protein